MEQINQKHTAILLHLSLIKDVGPTTALKLFKALYHDVYPDVMHVGWMDVIEHHASLPFEQLYDFTVTDFVKKAGLTEAFATQIAKGLADKAQLELELERIHNHDTRIISVFDAEYPEILKQIHAPPLILYCRGAALSNNVKRIGIVGSRKANDYARKVINNLIPGLVRHDWHIVSGGAHGADTMAHEAALAAGGVTVVVMGSGFLQPYPPANKNLFEHIVHNSGTVISPFSMLTPPEKGNFPARNRILSGLSLGCVVIQAAEKSGTLITGNCALEQGRQVFAVPGLIDDELSAGCHNLIKQGAKLVNSVNDILEEFGEYYPELAAQAPCKIPELVTPAQRLLESDPLLALLVVQPATLDELFEKTGMDVMLLQDRLFELQLEGKVQQNFVGMWELTSS